MKAAGLQFFIYKMNFFKEECFMNTKKRSTGLWRGLTAIFASLLALSVGASSILQANSSFVYGQLGLKNYKIVDTAGDVQKDS